MKRHSTRLPLRDLFAAHPDLLSPVLQIIHQVISPFLIKQAGLKLTQAGIAADWEDAEALLLAA